MSDETINYDDEIDFNQSIDDEVGEVKITSVTYMPSKILYELNPEVYELALSEYKQQEFDELKQTIFDRYPSSIAYYFRLSERGEGAFDPVKKLLHLKDTWEAIIFILYAITFGEVRKKGIDLKTANVYVGGNPSASFNSRTLLSDALKQKLENIKAVIQYSTTNSLNLNCEIIEIDLLNELLELQNVRNDISHHASPTREQAEAELGIVLPIFEKMIMRTRFLENCKIYRFIEYSTKCKCEVYNGHALNKEFELIEVGDSDLPFIIALGQEQLFLEWETEYYSLSPFLHYEKDATGHETYLCFYKGKRESKFWYEPVKLRTEKSFDTLQTRFDNEKQELVNLIVPTT